jgi:hypothetical protein
VRGWPATAAGQRLREHAAQLGVGEVPVHRGHVQACAHPGSDDDRPLDPVLGDQDQRAAWSDSALAQQVGELVGALVELPVSQAVTTAGHHVGDGVRPDGRDRGGVHRIISLGTPYVCE